MKTILDMTAKDGSKHLPTILLEALHSGRDERERMPHVIKGRTKVFKKKFGLPGMRMYQLGILSGEEWGQEVAGFHYGNGFLCGMLAIIDPGWPIEQNPIASIICEAEYITDLKSAKRYALNFGQWQKGLMNAVRIGTLDQTKEGHADIPLSDILGPYGAHDMGACYAPINKFRLKNEIGKSLIHP
tara:strand:+ start:3950 stop:4507 length:558 start_codon:yes stop_codon:yes gene_type:complete